MLAPTTAPVAFRTQQRKSANAVRTKLMQEFDPEDFNKKLGSLIDKIRSQAVMPKNEGLGKGESNLSSFLTVYALVQCTRDLAVIDCAQCLAIAVGNFPNFCNNKKGCRALYSNCYVRYELYPFFFPLDSSNSSSLIGQIMQDSYSNADTDISSNSQTSAYILWEVIVYVGFQNCHN
ncbi:hypothetical protein GH714_027276 [Hevea brasiliensis]|uniref:Gnk2-homologous domain-containing protein n=1 Tax=Hevea brasiliensis TaxID=3981 RepID=A0A6A6KAU5_HEVBR|nr:hypothetical protein GH714_027276 [Hevea brasiliensis]